MLRRAAVRGSLAYALASLPSGLLSMLRRAAVRGSLLYALASLPSGLLSMLLLAAVGTGRWKKQR